MNTRKYTANITDITGVSKVVSIEFKDADFVGSQGEQGTSVKNVVVDEHNNLIFVMSDDTSLPPIPLSAIEQKAQNIKWTNNSNGAVGSDIDQVQEILDKLVVDFYYVEPVINNFTPTLVSGSADPTDDSATPTITDGSTYHFRPSETVKIDYLEWGFNKKPTSIKLSILGTDITTNSTEESPLTTTGSYQDDITITSATTNKTVKIKMWDEKNHTKEKTLTYAFDIYDVKYGWADVPASDSGYDATFISGLAGTKSIYKNRLTATNSNGEPLEPFELSAPSAAKAIFVAVPSTFLSFPTNNIMTKIQVAGADSADDIQKVKEVTVSGTTYYVCRVIPTALKTTAISFTIKA